MSPMKEISWLLSLTAPPSSSAVVDEEAGHDGLRGDEDRPLGTARQDTDEDAPGSDDLLELGVI